ncbi:hypothetical protein D3C81_1757690 [compost metagenome]
MYVPGEQHQPQCGTESRAEIKGHMKQSEDLRPLLRLHDIRNLGAGGRLEQGGANPVQYRSQGKQSNAFCHGIPGHR